MGHIVSKHGINTDPQKVQAVIDWATPSTPKQLRSFLGLASYYRRFFSVFWKGCCAIVQFYHKLLSSEFPNASKKLFFEKWNSECEKSFVLLKELLTSAPIVGYADYTKPFVLEVDASLNGLGAVLSQHQDGVIACASRSLRPNERNVQNYSSRRLELLALYWSITDKFRDYLVNSSFTVCIDNNPLVYLQSSKLSAYEQRWVSQLALVSDPVNGETKQYVLPSSLKLEILKQCHDNLGHQGTERSFSVIKD